MSRGIEGSQRKPRTDNFNKSGSRKGTGSASLRCPSTPRSNPRKRLPSFGRCPALEADFLCVCCHSAPSVAERSCVPAGPHLQRRLCPRNEAGVPARFLASLLTAAP